MRMYALVWQAVLMLLAGTISVLASLAGYLRSGGAEQLLQQALVNFVPTGKAQFDSLRFNFREGALTVYGLRHSDITDGQDRVTGLAAEAVTVKADLWPWPPPVESVRVSGMKGVRIAVEEGFFRRAGTKVQAPPFPVHFEDVDLGAKVGDGPWLELRGCSGHLQRGARGEVLGELALRELNGQPFHFSLAALAGDRWELRGRDLAVDTRMLRAARAPAPPKALDPVELLLRTLWTGETEARGVIPSLRLVVQKAQVEAPGAPARPFACEGEIAYRDLELLLPRQPAETVRPAPWFLEWMLGGRRSLWPRYFIPDAIRTGPEGRLRFCMEGRRLEFSCDEGPGGSFAARASQREWPPLEGLKGNIETNEEGQPARVTMRGFLGDRMSFELRMQQQTPSGRLLQLLLTPRAANSSTLYFEAPLWRVLAEIQDFSDTVAPGSYTHQDLVRFRLEAAAPRLSESLLPLPSGVREVSGRLTAGGRFTTDRELLLSEVTLREGQLVFGGPTAPAALTWDLSLLDALQTLWAAPGAELRFSDLLLTGQAKVQFDRENAWASTSFFDCKLLSGRLLHQGQATDLGAARLEMRGRQDRRTEAPPGTEVQFDAFVPSPGGKHEEWSLHVLGSLNSDRTGKLTFEENLIPLKLHPERLTLPQKFLQDFGGGKRVRRTTMVQFRDGRAVQEQQP